ncbi:MAG: amino acid racemase [Oscillospiraceae bacterium]
MEASKPLGVLGGMGPQATQIFYQRILDRTEAGCDQEHLPALILSDTEMPDRTAAILAGDTGAVYARLLADARLLEGCGCRCIAIPCNTSHVFVPDLQREVTVPIISMVQETVERLCGLGKKRVGILATDGTLAAEVYQKECSRRGMTAVVPGAETQKIVMSMIYDEIKKGETGSREKFLQMDRELRLLGCDSAILGCTELSVYRVYHGLPDFYVDAMEVLVEKSITFCGKKLRNV